MKTTYSKIKLLGFDIMYVFNFTLKKTEKVNSNYFKLEV